MNIQELQAAAQKVATDLEAGFRSVIPHATLHIHVDDVFERLDTSSVMIGLKYTLLERDQYPFNIARNDPAYISLCLTIYDDGSMVASIQNNSVYVNPKVAYLAMSRESVGLRNGKVAKNDPKVFGVKTAQKIKDAILKHKEEIYRSTSADVIDAAIAKLEAL